ncbi:Annexin_9 [Hexamita inflata]|uniref:Annexin 9 n=1 Tax=Hexamita inflata TaxID=28002 RepID=A0AA86QAA2_9EUKA|nr:Annexin 9 [Hexamita inflata]
MKAECKPEDLLEQALLLSKAMKGLGTNEKLLIQVASAHNHIDRFAIQQQYLASTGTELQKHFKSELSGNMCTLFQSLFQDRYLYWCNAIHTALTKNESKHLINLILLLSPADTVQVSAHYFKLFKATLTQALNTHLGNKDWEKLLKAWVVSTKSLSLNATETAEKLYKAAKGAGTDEDQFVAVLCNCSKENYAGIDSAYFGQYGKKLADVIKSEFTLRSEIAFLTAHYLQLGVVQGVAYQLYAAMKGLGTDDDSLISATALYQDQFKGAEIVQAYAQFGDLKKDFKGDLSGKYEDAVLALWGL